MYLCIWHICVDTTGQSWQADTDSRPLLTKYMTNSNNMLLLNNVSSCCMCTMRQQRIVRALFSDEVSLNPVQSSCSNTFFRECNCAFGSASTLDPRFSFHSTFISYVMKLSGETFFYLVVLWKTLAHDNP